MHSDLSNAPNLDVRFNTTPQFHRCEAGWQWHPAPLPDYDLWYVLAGVGEMNWNEQIFPLSAGTCFVFPPGSRPHGRHDPRRRLLVFSVHFGIGAAGNISYVGEDPTAHFAQGAKVRDQEFFTMLAQRCENAFIHGGTLGLHRAALCLQQMLLQLQEEALLPAKSTRDNLLKNVVTAIRQDPGAQWNVCELARRSCLSPSQFSRRFCALTNMSPGNFVVQARVQRARQLVLETEMSISQIAYALGYSDVHFFSRQFKQCTGQSPGSLRRTPSLCRTDAVNNY
jgi:AraC-like DNA-binding protein